MSEQLIAITLIVVIVNAIITLAAAIATIAQSGVIQRLSASVTTPGDLQTLANDIIHETTKQIISKSGDLRTVAKSGDIDETNKRLESIDNEIENLAEQIQSIHRSINPDYDIDFGGEPVRFDKPTE